MSAVTHTVTRKFGGMPNYAFMKRYWSRIDGKPFLSRFILFRTPWASIDITRIHMADNQREFPHDHSRNFWSFKLLGGYEEDVYLDPADLRERVHKSHGWLSVHKMSRHHAHSITKVSPMLVTVLFLGRQKQKSNYWVGGGRKESIGFAVDQDEWS